MSQPTATQLLEFIKNAFDLEELQTLCFQLYVPYDDLAGQTREGKARELIEFMQRVGRSDDLIATLAHERPIAWQQQFGAEDFARVEQTARATPKARDPQQVFLSHAHQDSTFAHRLAGDLRQRGYTVWIVPESIRPGERWVDAINRALKESGIFVLVSTPHAVDSLWVQDETSYAIELAAKEKIRFIRLDVAEADVPPMWSVRQYIPFRNYAAGLKNLELALSPPAAGPDSIPEATAAIDLPDPAVGPATQAPPSADRPVRTGRPRWLIPAGIGVAVLLLVGGLALYNQWRSSGAPDNAAEDNAGDALAILATQQVTSGASATSIITRTMPVTEGVAVEQVYVPGGSFQMGVEEVNEDMQPVHTVALDAFWLDRHEVTNAQYEACVAAGTCVPPRDFTSDSYEAYYRNPEFADFPVIHIDWSDAVAYCEWAGGRLPSEAEWEYAARGPNNLYYPWGEAAPDPHLANYNYYIGDVVRVGSYPAGASWVGALDMSGNVFEWVADYYAYDYYYRAPSESPPGPQSGSTRVARGGSFAAEGDYLASGYRFEVDPDDSSVEGGFRCAYEALSRTVTLPGGLAVNHVRVPGGTFEMGAENGEDDEAYVHTVTLESFWLDRTEVTNEQFAAFTNDTEYVTLGETEGGWSFDGEDWSYIEGANWRHPTGTDSNIEEMASHPVVIVSWEDAVAYCRWAGGDLPTEAQWEYAARGPDSAIWPWGDAYDRENLNYCDANCPFDYADQDYDDGYAFSSPVGTYPDGASWVGAVDMLGNVWEWARDWYGEAYYSRSPEVDPPGPDIGTMKIVRGGAWDVGVDGITAFDRAGYEPTDRDLNLGFRCAYQD